METRRVKLSRSEVQQWLDEVAPGTGLVRLAQLAALPRLRITQQVSRGSVLPATIASISRGLGLKPLAELAKFKDFDHLVAGSPTREELSAFIPTDALLEATGASSLPEASATRTSMAFRPTTF